MDHKAPLAATPLPDDSSSDFAGSNSPQKTFGQVLMYYFTGGLYFIGGWSFLVGSILYYPGYANIYDIVGEGSLIGAWLFVVGCITFLTGSCVDTFNARLCEGDDIVAYFPFVCSLTNVIGSVQFLVGAVYFVPVVYATASMVGCYLFITGCSCFVAAILVDVARMLKTGHIMSQIWWFLCCIFNCVGNILFIVGSYYFLPRFLAPENDPNGDIATANTIFAVNNFVVGSVAFVLAPTFQLVALYKDANTISADMSKEPQV
ncbi:hypothetical protein THRCLA_20264 [Thraustotheca clavata]|uniref:YrhK domain-containing protein n=1 Tax=Thraustotheca clavata TaxID=74557 RepID=A0A1W0A9P3_9STRA|nr:hypothetical protein THRCLA_20264 [Thraustotheca clavata]